MFFYLPSSCYVVKKPRKWYSLGNVSKPASHLTHRYLITKSIWRLIDAWQARNEVAYPWWCPQNSLVVVISWWNTGRTTEWEEKNIDRRKKMKRKKKKEKKMGKKKKLPMTVFLIGLQLPHMTVWQRGRVIYRWASLS